MVRAIDAGVNTNAVQVEYISGGKSWNLHIHAFDYKALYIGDSR
jgi:hypothetical protein